MMEFEKCWSWQELPRLDQNILVRGLGQNKIILTLNDSNYLSSMLILT